jgi:hypothetical protein
MCDSCRGGCDPLSCCKAVRKQYNGVVDPHVSRTDLVSRWAFFLFVLSASIAVIVQSSYMSIKVARAHAKPTTQYSADPVPRLPFSVAVCTQFTVPAKLADYHMISMWDACSGNITCRLEYASGADFAR